MNMRKRKATYTVEVPLKFTYSADNDLTGIELIKSAEKELERRLNSGYFDVLKERLEVVNKIPHYTRQEILEQNKMWDEILKPVPKRTNIFKSIFRGFKR